MAIPRNLDIDLLRAFSLIAQEQNISRAAQRLLRNQSTVSIQLKKLEDLIGQRLFERNSRFVRLTREGETLLNYASQILDLNDKAFALISEPEMQGVVRLGVPEDFATTHMPVILGEFARTHPLVTLEVTCDLTLKLMDGFRQGQFDIALVKREPSVRLSGVKVWREPLVWVGKEGFSLAPKAEIPLVVSPEPCVYRKRAINALRRARLTSRIAYTCGSVAGSLAAVSAGLGISVLPREMVPEHLTVLHSERLPKLDDTEIALVVAAGLSMPATRLSEHIVESLERKNGPGRRLTYG